MMAAIGLRRRLTALEGGQVRDFVPWVRIIQDIDQTKEQAFTAYEAEHGPVGDRNVILRVII